MLRRLVRWLQPAALLLSIVAIGWFLSRQWPVLRSYPWRLDWGWLLTTFIFTWASWGVEIALWRHLLFTLGSKLPYWVAARIWFLSAIVRYVPGNIWQPISMTLYARRHGVPPEATITSLVLFQVVMLLAIAPIFVVYFLWLDTQSFASQFLAQLPSWLLWAALIPVVAFLVRPQWLIGTINWVLVRIKRPPLAARLTSGALCALVLVAFIDWLLWGGVFASFTFAVAGDGVTDRAATTPMLVSSFALASAISLLGFFTPNGFGVREGAFYLLLTPQIAGSVVTVIALGIRVWGILNELLMALICAPFEHAATVVPVVESGTELPMPRDSSLREPVVASDLRREIT